MDVLFDISFDRLRLRQMEEPYPESTGLGDCDCRSYTYFLASIVLLTLGTLITVPALGGVDHYVFSNLGNMWIGGPICICSGLMVAIKSLLYLRRKSMIQMLLRQRAFIRGLQELAQQSRTSGNGSGTALGGSGPRDDAMVGCGATSASTLTLPPAYDLIIQPSLGMPTTELPPPSYAEAILLITAEKQHRQHLLQHQSSRDES